ncbi:MULTISPECIES: flagellar basal body rod protein FlgB [Pirellulaceae]|nr:MULTISPECIES: flagellar basal body rod protein FlgB [Pirellulaceae]MCS7471343.1 flagellar basal body rod protein FlgB [Stieleria sedimenti]MDV6029310.1 flagellar basal body rod protein FlgB [Phycisphaera sp. RhM]PAY18691.1 flagellar basal body rod protein FlgB [Rhodopirellula sp. SM50]
MSGIFYQMDLLGSAVNASEKSHRVVSQNIANVNTPGYKTKRLEFERLLAQLQSSEAKDGAGTELPVKDLEGLEERVDGNNVNLEKEVAELKENALAFQAFSHLLASRVSTMRRAISG